MSKDNQEQAGNGREQNPEHVSDQSPEQDKSESPAQAPANPGEGGSTAAGLQGAAAGEALVSAGTAPQESSSNNPSQVPPLAMASEAGPAESPAASEERPSGEPAAQDAKWQQWETEWLAGREEPAPAEAAPGQAQAEATEKSETAQAAGSTPEEKPDQTPVPSRVFAGLSWIAPLLLAGLAVLLAAQPAWLYPEQGRIAPGPEARQTQNAWLAARFEPGLGPWIIPQIDGQPASDVFPLQLWWKAVLGQADSLLPVQWQGCLAPILAAWLLLLATMALGWSDTRYGRQGGLAAGLVGYCGLAVLGTVLFAPEQLLAPALSILAAACLLRGLKQDKFSPTLVLGGLFMALAVLGGGPMLGLLPLAAALLTIIFQLNFSRLGRWDLVFALGLALLLLGGWFTAGLLFAGSGPLRVYLDGLDPLAGTAGPLWNFTADLPLPEYIAVILLCLLPWLLLPLLMPVRSLKALGRGLREWRQKQKYTPAIYVGIFFLLAAATLMLSRPFHEGLLLSALAGLAALAARSLTNLTPAQNNRWGALCALFMLAAAALTVLLFMAPGREWLERVMNLYLPPDVGLKIWLAPAVAALIGAVTLWFFGRGRSSQAGLLVLAFTVLLYTQAFAWSALSVIHPQLLRGPGPVLPESLLPEVNLVSPLPPRLEDPAETRLHLPLPPDPDTLVAPVPPHPEPGGEDAGQPNILGAPLPGVGNSTRQPGPMNGVPADGGPVDGMDAGLGRPGAEAEPIPEAGSFMYGDDLRLDQEKEAPTTPVAPYQPGLQLQEPPLPRLDTPGAPENRPPAAPLAEPYPPQN